MYMGVCFAFWPQNEMKKICNLMYRPYRLKSKWFFHKYPFTSLTCLCKPWSHHSVVDDDDELLDKLDE